MLGLDNYKFEVEKKKQKITYEPRQFFNVYHTYHEKDLVIPCHWHNSIEITFVCEGEKIQRTKSETIHASKGTLLLVNSQELHELEVKKGLEGYVLLIDREAIDYYCPDCAGKAFNVNQDPIAYRQIIHHLRQLVHFEEMNQRGKMMIEVLEILHILSTKLACSLFYEKETKNDLVNSVKDIIEYINTYYMNNIELEELARLTGYSRTYVSHLFKQYTGVSIFEYIKNIRLQHALDLLIETDKNIVDISMNVGFKNIQLFNKAFKDNYLMTPNQYRKSRK